VLAAFPQAWHWKPVRFNELVLGLDVPVERETLASRVQAVNPQVDVLAELFAADVEPVSQVDDPLTDDRAPVEWLTDRMIVEHITRGGELDEDLLPTGP